LLKEEQTAAYTVEIWKRFRKWGGIPTGLTQNVKDLLASREIENIFENLYCKGYMSNVLLLQQSSQPIRSSLRLGQPRGGDNGTIAYYRKPLPKLQNRARMRRVVRLYAPETFMRDYSLTRHYQAA
jgi:hypothetical protein